MKYTLSILVSLGVIFGLAARADQYEREMTALAVIESSNGKNLKHPMITQGPQKGDTASGKWGLVPNTVRMLVGSQPLRRHYKGLLKMSNAEIVQYVNQHPDIDYAISRHHWTNLRQRFGTELSALAWWAGSGLAAHTTDQEAVLFPYVARFMSVLQELPQQ